MRPPERQGVDPPCEYPCRVRDKESNCPTESAGLAAENQPFRWPAQQKNLSMPQSGRGIVRTSGPYLVLLPDESYYIAVAWIGCLPWPDTGIVAGGPQPPPSPPCSLMFIRQFCAITIAFGCEPGSVSISQQGWSAPPKIPYEWIICRWLGLRCD